MGQTIGDGIYKQKDWLYEQLIIKNKTEQQIADELGITLRLVRKWVCIHKLGDKYYASLKRLNNRQIELIKASLLGDGHIHDDHIHGATFYVSHAGNQKDYLYWKYSILKDVCRSAPTYYPPSVAIFRGKESIRSESYRFNTRRLNHLKELNLIPKATIVKDLTEFELAIWLLDDGYRDEYTWDLCLGSLDQGVQKEISVRFSKLGLKYTYRKDPRYIRFNGESTKKLDGVILDNVPNDLDIVKYKILERR